MFVRRLALALSLVAVIAGATAGASVSSSKGGFKFPTLLPPFKPYTKVFLPVLCQFKGDQVIELDCHSTAPNPDPPKQTTSAKVNCAEFSSKFAPGKLTVYPNGDVTISCRLKGL
jgi:hypothetical protein